MTAIRVIAALLIIGGIAGFAFGGFSYTKATHEASIGPIDLSIKEQRSVNIPAWASTGAIVLGIGLLVLRGKA